MIIENWAGAGSIWKAREIHFLIFLFGIWWHLSWYGWIANTWWCRRSLLCQAWITSVAGQLNISRLKKTTTLLRFFILETTLSFIHSCDVLSALPHMGKGYWTTSWWRTVCIVSQRSAQVAVLYRGSRQRITSLGSSSYCRNYGNLPVTWSTALIIVSWFHSASAEAATADKESFDSSVCNRTLLLVWRWIRNCIICLWK